MQMNSNHKKDIDESLQLAYVTITELPKLPPITPFKN